MAKDIKTRLRLWILQKGAVDVRRACKGCPGIYPLGLSKVASNIDEKTEGFPFPELFTDISGLRYGGSVVVASTGKWISNVAPLVVMLARGKLILIPVLTLVPPKNT